MHSSTQRLRFYLSPCLCGALLTLSNWGCSPAPTDTQPPETIDPKPDFEVVEASIHKIQQALRRGTTSCRQVVSAYLERINHYDKTSGLNAITVLNPNALARADEIDRSLSEGHTLGSLFCAPLLIKDNFDTHDLPTTGGSIAMMDNLPPDDAFMVQKLRQADAIVIAKTNMAEWAFSARQTVSSSYGTTANAYALDRVPAGSSGGTASGTAASFGVAGMGTDTGNSIRGPASHLALFGIRATIGLTSRDGIIPLVFDRDVAGPLTRIVTDAAMIFNVIAGFDAADPLTQAGKGKREPDYTLFLNKNALQGKRIGVLRALVNTSDADPEIVSLFENALHDLVAEGAELVDPFQIRNFQVHLEGDYFCPRFRYDMHNYLAALGPEAPISDVNDVLKTGQYSPYIKDRLEYFAGYPLDTPPSQWQTPCPPYLEHPGRKAYLTDVLASMDAVKIDAIVYPTWTNPPAHLAKAREEYKGDNSQLIAPATGMPAVTVPMGFSHGTLPAGLQILARPYAEGLLFSLAYAYEQATRHRHPPARFPPLKTPVAEAR